MNVDQIFKREGPLSKYLPNYLPRPGQVALAKAVESSLRDGRHLLAEGPTGTGKSLAYGIPAAVHALAYGESVIIATANIALQEQLAKKDLPLIKSVMTDLELGDLKFYSRKGLGNYVCKYKLDELVRETHEAWPRELQKWVKENDIGDREELPVDYHEKWWQVAANRDECHHRKCRYHDDCYAFRSRITEVEGGCIVVTNYHLLYADRLVVEATGGTSRLLPEYSIVVMDEAHEAVEIARGFQGFEFSMASVGWTAKRFRKLVPSSDVLVEKLRDEGRAFFEKLMAFHKEREGGVFHEPLGFGHQFIAIMRDCGATALMWSDRMKGHEEEEMLRRLGDLLFRRAYEVESTCYGLKENQPGLLFAETEEETAEWDYKVNDEPKKLGEKSQEPETGVLEEDSVYYTETEQGERGLTVKLCKKVIEVQDFLRQQFLDCFTLIGTSATLSTNGNFNFIAKELGLDADEYASLIAPSPFDAKKMLVVVPCGFPSPKDREQHIYAVTRSIERIVQELGGRSMALFTSYKSLNAASEYLSKKLQGIDLLVQGKLPRGKIVEMLKQNERSLILATASFWQGVDIPGRALSCLFIEKFPFAPPTDPVMAYMEDKLARKNGDRFAAFTHYSVPKAVIALKQGVGRLIRKESDYGAVVLFDTRLETANYGDHFESAFPMDHYRSDDLSLVVKFIRDHDLQEDGECSTTPAKVE